MPQEKLRIGELAKRTDSRVEMVRYYEHGGLLPALEPKATIVCMTARMWSDCNSSAIAAPWIWRWMKSSILLGFRDAPAENCGKVNILLGKHIQHVAARITELKAREKQLKGLRNLCQTARAGKTRGVLQGL